MTVVSKITRPEAQHGYKLSTLLCIWVCRLRSKKDPKALPRLLHFTQNRTQYPQTEEQDSYQKSRDLTSLCFHP